MKAKTYPDKILLAWGEAMVENEAITKWLSSNGYPELVSTVLSLRGSKQADKWLFEQGHPELVAFVEWANEKEAAGNWLKEHGFEVYYYLGAAANEVEGAMQWLADKNQKALLILAQRLKQTVTEVHFDANDVHKSPFR